MAKSLVKKGSTSRIEYLWISDSGSAVGAGKTGLAFNTASLTGYYVRRGASATSITLATQTVTGAFSSGGFVEVDATNMPGLYRFDPPDAAFATGVNKVIFLLKGASGMAPVVLEYQLIDFDPEDAAALGLTNLDATVSSRLATAGYTAPLSAADTRTAVGLATANLDTQLSGIQSDADDIQTRLPAALVSGRMDASVGAMGANVLTATAINADAFTAAKFAADVTTELQAGLSTLDAAGVRAAVGLASANLDTQLDTLPTAAENADAVWDEAIAGHAGAGSTGEALATAAAGGGSTPPTAIEIADAFLDRDMSTGADSGSPTVRTPRQALRALRNKWTNSGGAYTVYKEDDTTSSWTSVIATDAGAVPVIGSDPA